MTVSQPPSILATFRPLAGETFTMRDAAGNQLEVMLAAVDSLGFNTPAERGGQECFTLLFIAPSRARVAQGTFAYTHPRAGTFDFFSVPLGPDSRGQRIEVIFNFT